MLDHPPAGDARSPHPPPPTEGSRSESTPSPSPPNPPPDGHEHEGWRKRCESSARPTSSSPPRRPGEVYSRSRSVGLTGKALQMQGVAGGVLGGHLPLCGRSRTGARAGRGGPAGPRTDAARPFPRRLRGAQHQGVLPHRHPAAPLGPLGRSDATRSRVRRPLRWRRDPRARSSHVPARAPVTKRHQT